MSTLPAGLRVVAAANPSPMTLDGTRTYLVGRSRPAVIDPGPDLPDHLDALLDALGGVRPVAILLTHAHADHAACAAALATRVGAQVWLARGALHPHAAAGMISHWTAGGDTVATDAGLLRALATPGHAPEHMAFVWDAANTDAAAPVVFVGDLLMGEGDTALVAAPEGNLSDYLASLERVDALGAALLVPTHGPPLREPAAAIARYTHHRETRLAAVQAALDRGVAPDPAALVDAVYGPTLPPALRGAAEGSVLAMLEYLRAGG